jgi:sporulation integral membrane protein YtvI
LSEFYRDNKKTVEKALFITLTVLASYLIARYVLVYFVPFIIGYVISLIIGKPVDFLNKNLRIWRTICVLSMILFVAALITLGGYLLISRLIREMESLISHLPTYVSSIQNFLDGAQYHFERFTLSLPEGFAPALDEIVNRLAASAAANLTSLVTRVTLNTAAFIPGFVITVVFSIISAYFFTKDKERIAAALSKNLPDWFLENFRKFKRRLSKGVGGYIKAQLVLMAVVIAITTLGLAVIGNPYAIFIGIAIGFIDILPILGAGSILVPWAVVAFVMGNVSLGVSLLVIYGVCVLIRQSLESKIVGEHIGVHPLLTLMSIFIGLQIFGALGIILGPFVAIAFKAAFTKENVV